MPSENDPEVIQWVNEIRAIADKIHNYLESNSDNSIRSIQTDGVIVTARLEFLPDSPRPRSDVRVMPLNLDQPLYVSQGLMSAAQDILVDTWEDDEEDWNGREAE